MRRFRHPRFEAPFLLLAIAGVLLTVPIGAQSTAHRPGLVEATISELQGAMSSGQLTSRQIVRIYLERIRAYDDRGPQLNAFLELNPRALAEAHARDIDRANGLAHGPLFGIPVLLKDNIDTGDMPTTAGAFALADSIPPDDAFLVQKLRAAGAVILGKATLTELANAITLDNMPQGYSALGGFSYNPYDPRPNPGGDGRPVLSPGGSSSGSCIAVAANLVPVAVGTETSGSILWPSHANSVVGIKPTRGLISRDGMVPFVRALDVAGPIARTVTDAAVLLGILAGYDPSDPETAACLVPGNCHDDYTVFLDRQALVGARIAVPHAPYWSSLGFSTNPQRALASAAIAVLRAEGAVVVDPYEIPNQAALNLRTSTCTTYPPDAGCNAVPLYSLKQGLDDYLGTLGPLASVHSLADLVAFNDAHAGEALMYGQAFLRQANRMDTSPGSNDTVRFDAEWASDYALFKGALDALFDGPDGIHDTADDFDAILYPAYAGIYANAVAGHPSIEIPAGYSRPVGYVVNPIPSGIMLAGPAFSEGRLIGLAYAFEQATRHRRPPESAPGLPW